MADEIIKVLEYIVNSDICVLLILIFAFIYCFKE